MEYRQDVFISHASADKLRYIEPLADALGRRSVTYWLDSREIGWGDSIAVRINEGLTESRYGLLCLSARYLERPWPEQELSALFAMQNATGIKRVLPLILDSKDQVLTRYPLIAGVAYREFSMGPEALANDLAALIGSAEPPSDALIVSIESAHTGHISRLTVPPNASLRFLLEKAKAGAGLRDRADTGGFEPFAIRWVLVDVRADEYWQRLPRRQQQQLIAVVMNGASPRTSRSERDRLNDLGVEDGTVFHMYAIEDLDQRPPMYRVAPDRW